MEIKNYYWKDITFEIRDLIIEKFGYREKYHISNVVKSTDDDEFKIVKLCNMDIENYVELDTIYLELDTITIPVKFKKYNDEFTSSFLILSYNKSMEYDVSNIVIDRWVKVLEKTYEDVKKLEKIQKIYMDNDIDIRFVITLMHEIGHAFEDVEDSDDNFVSITKAKRLNFTETNVLYHRRKRETLADVVSINSLYLYGEEILNIILKNKKIQDHDYAYDLKSMFSYILECNESFILESKELLDELR